MNRGAVTLALAVLPILHLAGRVESNAIDVAIYRVVGKCGAFVRAYDTASDRQWFSFAAEGDTLIWPRGARMVLTLADSTEVEALEVCALDTDGNAIPLGGRSILLTKDDVGRQRFRRGPVCSVIFAAFLPTLDPGLVIATRLEPRR